MIKYLLLVTLPILVNSQDINGNCFDIKYPRIIGSNSGLTRVFDVDSATDGRIVFGGHASDTAFSGGFGPYNVFIGLHD